jgi:ornithine carbamoyltransferase
MPRHFLDLFDVTSAEAAALLDQAERLKADPTPIPAPAAGRMLALIFEKPSLRTRVSFEAAMNGLGGASTFLRGEDVGLGVRESVRDFARVISQYVDVLAIRTFSHVRVQELARHASIPIINNVARSLAVAAARFGVKFTLASPPEYDFPTAFRERFEKTFPETPLAVDHDPERAVAGAQVVYTDVWASMGQEEESAVRRAVFAPYQVNSALFARADPEAIFLHCLPAHRGEEVSEDVLDSERSLVIPQAGNRLHVQKALLDWILGTPA